MSLFDTLVSRALAQMGELAPLRPVVEKELLHHDILREMNSADLLGNLVFIGGTCLRACYGSKRLSEDLDFTGGVHFQKGDLQQLGSTLTTRLETKYDLRVEVSEPTRSVGKVTTWKMKIITRPDSPHLPVQKIHIDICAIPSYDPRPMVLRNHYGIEMGTSGLIIQAQSREEILADKMVAFTLRPNRVKNRDLWDISWLKQQNVEIPVELVERKIADHGQTPASFVSGLRSRLEELTASAEIREAFRKEMQRFLPITTITETIARDEFWDYLVDMICIESEVVIRGLGI